MKTGHQLRIEEFMRLAGQELPSDVIVPSAEVRMLRAKLIMEECLETISDLGVAVSVERNGIASTPFHTPINHVSQLEFEDFGPCDLVGVADGCADISVVTIGTLSAFGIPDRDLLRIVDESNLRKFGPGSYRREDGKWIKPSDWKAPDIQGLLDDIKSRRKEEEESRLDAGKQAPEEAWSAFNAKHY